MLMDYMYIIYEQFWAVLKRLLWGIYITISDNMNLLDLKNHQL